MSENPMQIPDADAWDKRYSESALIWTAEPNVFVVEQTTTLTPGRAIDVAGGEGRNAVWLASRGWEAEVVEFSAVALGKAAQLAEARGVTVKLTQADATEPLPVEPADLVIIAYLQLPAEPLASALANAAAALRPGGTLLVVSHALENIADGYGGPQNPAVLVTAAQLRAYAEAAGLVVESSENRKRAVITADGPRTAIDVVLRASLPAA